MRKRKPNIRFTVSIMFGRIFELLISFVTAILGFFGFDIKKKNVTFAEDVKKEEEPVVEETTTAEAA